MKFGSLMQNNMPITGCGRGRNRKKNFNMADICFSKTEIVISQPTHQRPV